MNMSTVKAKDVLAEVMGYYVRVMTELEVRLWMQVISEFGDQAVCNFLVNHVKTSVFAPKLADAQKALNPSGSNAVAAFEELGRVVSSIGPYLNPKFDDPAIAGAVLALGGWAKVNEQLPDPSARFDFEAYFKRFDALYQQSCASILTGHGFKGELLGLHNMPAPPPLLAIGSNTAATEVTKTISYPSSSGGAQ